MAGDAELAHQKGVERHGNFGGHGHAPARQTEHDDIRPVGMRRQLAAKLAAGIGSVTKR